jgi:dienelactone hydrolase
MKNKERPQVAEDHNYPGEDAPARNRPWGGMSGPGHQITGMAAGVPFLASPPAAGPERAPLVVGWHLMEPPRSEAALASSLPMAALPAWRVYLGLPLTGARLPKGGVEEVMRRGYSDAVRLLYEPILTQAVAELPGAVADLRGRLPVGDGPIGVFGGSLGGGVALLSLAEAGVPVAAAAVVNAVVSVTTVVAAYEPLFHYTYPWDDESRAIAARLDVLVRAADIARSDRQPALLLVSGEQDHPGLVSDAKELGAELTQRYSQPERVALASVPNLAHPLAEEPGMDPAPQTEGAAQVDSLFTAWFRRHLTG